MVLIILVKDSAIFAGDFIFQISSRFSNSVDFFESIIFVSPYACSKSLANLIYVLNILY